MRTGKIYSIIVLTCFVVFLACGAAVAGNDLANGPFKYAPATIGSKTFIGDVDATFSGIFQICAPGGGSEFPSGLGGSADADIKIFGIEKVADEAGVPLDPTVKIALDSPLGQNIVGAFIINPTSHTFTPGSCANVGVSVFNPKVGFGNYGDYEVVIKAKANGIGADGDGIGVGSGARLKLGLSAPTLTDTIPPVVNIINPADGSKHILGPINVEIKANDPVPGTGVVSIEASISSAGGHVKDEAITLTTDVPKQAGADATGTGTFTPTGGTGTAGTTLDGAFTGSSLSGIGTYILSAKATDGAGNTGPASSTFTVNYEVAFTTQSGNASSKQAKFEFTVKRLDTTFMYDETVTVELIKISDSSVVATHIYGIGDIKDVIQIDDTNKVYKSHFRRVDLGVTTPDSYKARVLFIDVDGNLVQQAESDPVTF